MQYSTGTITVTNGSANVVGLGTKFLGNVLSGMLLTVVGTSVIYFVGGISDDTDLSLTAPYAGTSGTFTYVICKSYTPINNIPYPDIGDVQTATIVKAMAIKVDGLLDGLTIPNQLTLGTTGSGGVLSLVGATSGTTSITVPLVAGTYNFVLPTTAGTSGQLLTSGGGGTTASTWTSVTGTGSVVKQSGATLAAANGTSSVLAYGFASDSTSGMYLPATDVLALISGSTSLVMNGLGIGVGGANFLINGIQQSAFQLLGTVQAQAKIHLALWGASSSAPAYCAYKSRGTTIGTEGALLSADNIFRIQAQGSDGTVGQGVAFIVARADANFSSGSTPGRWEFQTSASGGTTPITGIYLDSKQNTGFNKTPATGVRVDVNGIIATNTGVISSNPPSIATNVTNAGTGATASVVGGMVGGIITLNTGTGTLLAGVYATITFPAGVTFPTGCSVILTSHDMAGATLPAVSMVTIGSTGSFTISARNALTASTTYTWNYVIVGY